MGFAIANCIIEFKHCPEQNDIRRYIALSTFGFYQKGLLEVNLTNFQIEDYVLGDTVSLHVSVVVNEVQSVDCI